MVVEAKVRGAGMQMHYERAGLRAALVYGAEVRVHNPRGDSHWSERFVVSLPVPVRSPKTPPTPNVTLAAASCDVRIDVPVLTKGDTDDLGSCAGAEALFVEGLTADATHWRVLPSETAVGTSVWLRGLPPTTAYRFRVVASNRIGRSSAGAATPEGVHPIIPGLPVATLILRPTVRPTSSASFVIDVPGIAATCQEELNWIVLARLEGRGKAWEVLGTAVQGSSYHIERLRCPTEGCSFKLRPDIQLWESQNADSPSVLAFNAALPTHGSPTSGVRIELRLKGIEWNSLLRQQFRVELAAQLRVSIDNFKVIETHIGASHVYVVVDLSAATAATAAAAAQRLADLLDDGRLAEVNAQLARLDRAAGVVQQAEGQDADWQPLLPKPRNSWGASALLGALQLHLSAFGVSGALALLTTIICTMTIVALRQRLGQSNPGLEEHELISKFDHHRVAQISRLHVNHPDVQDDDCKGSSLAEDDRLTDDDGWPT